ncbi:MAG: DUF2325 domain-containing protein [Rhodopila sp.]|nr:DUF2325 domain-containing protein [Rhodopila sp.]
MSGGGISIAIKSAANASVLSRPIDIHGSPPTLIKREVVSRRRKIWEFNTNLHCSIIGTCLSTGELRLVLKKFGMTSQSSTDHELHGIAVTLAGRHDDAARQLHKALDHRHKLAVSQLAKADSEDAVRAMWRDAVRCGDIPGAYWATLTHPLTTQAIIRETFGEVHMLSHLVGSANRADIRRLCQLESEKAALEGKVERQQHALHEAVVVRDAQIAALRQALAERIVSGPASYVPEESGALRGLLKDLERRLAGEVRRRAAVDERLAATQAALDRERLARTEAERACEVMRLERDAVEAFLLASDSPGKAPAIRLDGIVLLYVGGRPNQVTHMRTVTEGLGATFLHHDGGVENHTNLLPGLTSRCDLVLFPVDCISHDAANVVKSLCRQGGKRFIPLRSASITTLLTALQAPEMTGLMDAAD